VSLEPRLENYELKCGNQLLIKVLSQAPFTTRWGENKVDVIITGENVKSKTKRNRDTKLETDSETGN
jgi:hypothetical protein